MVSFNKNIVYQKKEWTVNRSKEEIAQGLEMLKKINKPIVTFCGSARTQPSDFFYKHALSVSEQLGSRGYAIITGAGRGIMEAAAKGATKAQTDSIGLRVEGHTTDVVDRKYLTQILQFKLFFAKRFIGLIKSRAIIYYPGGLGTLNELMENMMLIQNQAVDPIPLVCVGKKFWNHLFNWLDDETLKGNYLTRGSLDQVHILDTEEEILKLIENLK
ncbi:LOG family protein [Patescibacteria group bacterium]|nr:LOG family protein [Patescibacteria group bacterium]